MRTNEEKEIQEIVQLFDGEIVPNTSAGQMPLEAAAQKNSAFFRALTEEERHLLCQFSSMRHFHQIVRLVQREGLNSRFFSAAGEALREVGTFLPLNALQRVLFAVLYAHCDAGGSDISVDTVCEIMHLPSRRLLALIDWEDMQKKGLLEVDFSAASWMMRLPESVMNAVALVDMMFYLRILRPGERKNVSEKVKTAFFMAVARERSTTDDAGTHFYC